jgi:uncharacterized lipoprotein
MKLPSQAELSSPLALRHRAAMRPLLLACLIAAISTTGCGLLAPKRHYVESGEAPELQVPEDLDRPSYDPGLLLPPANNQRLLSGEELQPPPLGARGPATAGELYAPASGKTNLLLPNAGAEAWDLVAAALENSQTFQIIERDREQLRFRVALPQPNVVDRRPWWRRITGQGDAPVESSVAPEVIVRLRELAQGTEVSVVDDQEQVLADGRAARVIAALDLRLKSISTQSLGG